jgi:2-aminoadipate transaminase
MTLTWKDRAADRMAYLQDGIITEILKLTQRPDIISFAGGLPAPEFFPKARVAEATQRVMASPSASQALQYGLTEGYIPLREMVMAEMTAAGYPCSLDNILIVSGSQQGLDLAGKAYINRGDRILVEEPTYLGMLDAWRMYGAEFVSVATDDSGMIPEALEQTLKSVQAKLIYLVPTFQNPTGVTTPEERRAEIVRLARQYDVGIVEDDPYGQLRYEGETLPTVLAVDARQNPDSPVGGNVIYLNSFSKTLCPGLRLAWMAAPAEVIERVSKAKSNSDLHTSTFGQAVAYEVARDGFIEQHIQVLRKVYGERRDLMLHLMEDTFPSEVTWTEPAGGLFVWLRLPEGVNSVDVLKTAIQEHKVAYVPGTAFSSNGGGAATARLNFSNAPPDKIEEGIRRLAMVFEQACAQAANIKA